MFITLRIYRKADIRALAWVAKAISKDSLGRRALEGINFSHADGYLIAAASDGFRVHEARIPNVDMQITIAGLYKPEVISVSKKIIVLSSIADATFPDYERIIPKPGTPGVQAKLDRKFVAEAASCTEAPVLQIHEDPSKPITVEDTKDGIFFRGIVMPMHRARKRE